MLSIASRNASGLTGFRQRQLEPSGGEMSFTREARDAMRAACVALGADPGLLPGPLTSITEIAIGRASRCVAPRRGATSIDARGLRRAQRVS
jgi:hypothetical protein